MESKAARQYVSHIRRNLVCSTASRGQLLLKGKELIAQFDQENPDAQYSDFISAFGQPKDFAGEMLSAVDGGEVEAAHRRHKCIKQVALIGLVLVLLAAVAFWVIKWSNAQKVVNGDFRIEADSSQSISEDEFNARFQATKGEK